MKRGRVEGQDAGVDTEQCVSAQYFHVPVLEVKGLMQGSGRGGGVCLRDNHWFEWRGLMGLGFGISVGKS